MGLRVPRGLIRVIRLRPGELLKELRSSYWFVPLVLMLASGVLAVAVLLADKYLDYSLPTALQLVYPTSPDGARALLSAIVGSMITAISVTFSVTIVALTVAADHFGPRVLNNFVRHTSAQVVLGTFIGTFVYAVLVMGAIRGESDTTAIPQLAVSGAVVLVILSVGALIYYVHHVSTALQVGQIAADIAGEFEATFNRIADRRASSAAGEDFPQPPVDAAPIPADTSGYLQRVDADRLARIAEAAGVRLWVLRTPGHFAIAGGPIAVVEPAGAATDRLAQQVNSTCIFGRDRTTWQDPEFAINQLVEVALRALSPGVNEPFTALTCIDRLGQALACAATGPEKQRRWCDARGTPRVFIEAQPFESLLSAAIDPIRIFAGRNPAIAGRLIEILGNVAVMARTEDRQQALREAAERVRDSAGNAISNAGDRAFVESRFAAAARKWQAATPDVPAQPPT